MNSEKNVTEPLILMIESSGNVAGTALVRGKKVLAEYMTDLKKTHSETLMPMIDQMMELTGIKPSEINAVAVSGGPGSFTGLRIGSATAKGLALSLDVPMIHVPTIDAMAYQCPFFEGWIVPMMDARRNQVFTGIYRFDTKDGERSFEVIKPAFAMDITELLTMIKAEGTPSVLFLGDGAEVFGDKIREMLPGAVFAPDFMGKQRAGAAGLLAHDMYERGETEAAADHKPEYLRQSQAEREREKKLGQEQ
jgi:tRNA threonylcarbamoyladenosine biosynthesis protein TsaB